jgi:Zn-dependent hydrolases, including glyoxylases
VYITDKVYCFEAAKFAHAFLLAAENILIDCGLPWEGKKIIREMHEIGYDPTCLEHILLTHADLDHCGGLRKIAKSCPNATLWLGKDDVHYLRRAGFRRGLKGVALDILGPRLPKNFRVLEDWANSEVKAIHTPGHSDGHFAFKYDGCFFIGDVYKNNDGRLSSAKKNENEDVLAQTREYIKAIDCDIVIPSHGEIIKPL